MLKNTKNIAPEEHTITQEQEDQLDAEMQCKMTKDLTARDQRSLIFHLLYAMEAHDYETPLQSIIDNINRGFEFDLPFDHKAVTAVRAITLLRDELDASYIPFLKNWRIERVGLATKLILRYAMWEIMHTDTDTRIIINEAVELAKCFAEEDAHRFINGILDRAARALRSDHPSLKITTDDN